MCDCVRYWVQNTSVEGTHDRQPVTCEQVIADLKIELKRAKAADKQDPDAIRNAFGVFNPRFDFSFLDKENPQAD